METSTDRNIAAEARAVEEGHLAHLDRDAAGPYLKVISDRLPGVWYRVGAQVVGDGKPVIWTCDPQGAAAGTTHARLCNRAGVTPCKHAARAARRLQRHGLVVWAASYVDAAAGLASGSSCWLATITAEAAAAMVMAADRVRNGVGSVEAEERDGVVVELDPFRGIPNFEGPAR